MAENKIIVEVVIDSKEAQANAAALTKAIFEQRKALNEAKRLFTESGGASTEYANKINELEQSIKSNTSALTRERNAMSANQNSLQALRAETNRLNAEFQSLDTSTEAGAKRFKELTAQLKDNNERINEASKAAGSFRDNIGNYANSIKEAAAGNALFGNSFTQFIEVTQVANNTFKMFNLTVAANPLGLLLVTIGLITAALYSFFSSTKEGRLEMEKFGAVVDSIFKSLTNALANYGKFLYEFFTSPIQTAKKAVQGLADYFKDGFVPAVEKARVAVVGLFNAQRDLAKQAAQDAEKKSYLKGYIQDAEVAAARAEALAEEGRKLRDNEKLSFQERVAANKEVEKQEAQRFKNLREALLYQEQILEIELKSTKNASTVQEAKKKATFEELQALSDIRKELNLLDADFAGRTTETTTEAVSLYRDAENAKLEITKKRLEGELIGIPTTSIEAYRLRQQILDIEQKQALITMQGNSDERLAIQIDYLNKRKELDLEYRQEVEETQIESDEAFIEQLSATAEKEISLAQYVANENARLDNEKREREAQAAKDRQAEFEEQQRIEQLSIDVKRKATDDFISLTNMAIDAFGAQTEAGKIALIAQKALNAATVLSNLPTEISGIWTNANQIPPPFGQIFGGIQTAAAVARAAKAVVDIKSAAGFAKGGYTGDGGKHEPAGIVHRGEFVMPQSAVKNIGVSNLYSMMNATKGYASGGMVGGVARDISARPSFAMGNFERLIMNMPPSYVAIADIRKGQEKFNRVVDIANR